MSDTTVDPVDGPTAEAIESELEAAELHAATEPTPSIDDGSFSGEYRPTLLVPIPCQHDTDRIVERLLDAMFDVLDDEGVPYENDAEDEARELVEDFVHELPLTASCAQCEAADIATPED